MANYEPDKRDAEKQEIYERVARDIEQMQSYLRLHDMWWGNDLCTHLMTAYRYAVAESRLFLLEFAEEAEHGKPH